MVGRVPPDDNLPEMRVGFFGAPTPYKVGEKTILVDSGFTSSHRGLIKVVEVALCFLAMILVASSQGVNDERGFALLATFCGLCVSFAFLIAYILMLNTRIQQTPWFIMEVAIYSLMIIFFFLAGIFMWIFCANFWADRNPHWQLIPALASGALFGCAIVYIIDLVLQFRYWKRYTWRPADEPTNTQIPT